MTDWIRNIKHTPPPPNVMVLVLTSDYTGDCISSAQRIDYKKPRNGRKWRWCDSNGKSLDYVVDAWRCLNETHNRI